MEYDTIKLLNLGDTDIDLSTFSVIKINNTLECTIVLNKYQEYCPICGSLYIYTKDYRVKRITHSISKNNPCILEY